MVYDITNRESFENVQSWMENISSVEFSPLLCDKHINKSSVHFIARITD